MCNFVQCTFLNDNIYNINATHSAGLDFTFDSLGDVRGGFRKFCVESSFAVNIRATSIMCEDNEPTCHMWHLVRKANISCEGDAAEISCIKLTNFGEWGFGTKLPIPHELLLQSG